MSGILRQAQKSKYGVGYFESWNLESTRAVVSAASEERSPVIIGFNGTIMEEHGRDLEYYAAIGKVAVEKTQVPVALMLNEASSFKQIVRGIRYGFSSVMIDGSHLPYDSNVKLTRDVVEVAHSIGVSVEGQLDELPHAKAGIFSGKLTRTNMTDPEKARDFVNQTGIDALSVSVGNVHVMYRQQAEIDSERVREIAEATDIPLVIHGATSIANDSIKKAIESGICKVNVGTAVRSTFTDGVRRSVGSESYIDPESILEAGELQLKEFIKAKMKVYGSSGKA
jgi:tagatose 1,6-diphosphate aldolase GatY/KbaY